MPGMVLKHERVRDMAAHLTRHPMPLKMRCLCQRKECCYCGWDFSKAPIRLTTRQKQAKMAWAT